MKKLFVIFAAILISIGCQQVEQQQAGHENATTAAQGETPTPVTKQKRLVHIVWFELRDDATPAERRELLDDLKTLQQIPVVHDLEVGSFQDLKDQRSLSHLDVVMQMGFQSEAHYQTYQSHSVHLALKGRVGKYLSGPPVTYDYWSDVD